MTTKLFSEMNGTMEESEVTISGISGVFPKSDNIEEFERILFNNEDILKNISETDEKILGLLNDYENFDATFFGIKRSLATYTDLLFRKTLESTFEAIVDAGVCPMDIRGRKIAVMINTIFSDNEMNAYMPIENGMGLLTQAATMISNRISYWLHLTGPSTTVYNNWMGGMNTLEVANNYIKRGECEGAIICSLNTMRNKCLSYMYKDYGLLSKDGKTRSFDENATGYGRSDGVVVLFLQRADLARRQYASIVNVETIFNGSHSGTFTTINVDCARDFLTNFYRHAKVDPSTVQYVETNGSAIPVIDNIELNVLDQVFNNSSRTEPLLIGSVKSNIGHSESASVLMSIIKTIIAMERREIPANLNFEGNRKNPALCDGKLKVVTENTPWPGTLAAVNAYGLVSAFGHILLKSNTKSIKKDTFDKTLPRLCIFSTRTEEGIQEIIEKIKGYETLSLDHVNMINNVFSKDILGHLYRGYLIHNNTSITFDESSNYNGDQRPIWFVYSGMGSQWISMGGELMQIPIFAAAIHKCHAILKPLGLDIFEIICSNDNPELFSKILHCFVGIAAVQIGLTDILLALGIKPDNMIGHSVGELGCAYVDGCLTAEQMILAAYYRGRASQEVELVPGLMAAVGIGANKVKNLLPPSVDIACRNGPESCTLSGPAEDMRELVKRLQGSNIFARAVDVAGIAYHSRYIKPAAPLLFNYCKKIIPEPKLRSAKWLSSSVPEANGGWNTEMAQYASAEYLTNNLLNCVNFEALLKHIPNNAIVIEIAPHGLLQAILKRSLPPTCDNIALTKRGETKGVEFMMKNIGKLYLAGTQLNIPKLYEKDIDNGKTLTPCARGTPSLSPLVHWNYSQKYESEKNDITTTQYEVEYTLSAIVENLLYLKGHRIYGIDDNCTEGTITVPLITYMSLVENQIKSYTREKTGNIIFEDVQMFQNRFISDQINIHVPPITIMTLPGSNFFEVDNNSNTTIASGHCIISTKTERSLNDKIIKSNIGRKIDELTNEDLYREFTNRGHNFQFNFQAISKLEIYDQGMIANIKWTNEWHTFASNMLQMAIFHYGQSSHRSVEIVFIRSLKCFLNEENTPVEGSTIEVIYNYKTDIINSPIINIYGVRCQPYEIEREILETNKCYLIEPQNDFAVKNNEENTAVINIKESLINNIDMYSELSWVKELKKTLTDDRFENIYLIMGVLPIQGIDSFLAGIQKLSNANRVRLIITVDPKAPEFNSITDAFYQPAFKQQASNVSVYCKGVWEHRYTTSSKLKEIKTGKDNITSFISEQNIRRYLPDVNVRFTGINTVSMVPTLFNKMSIENQLGVIDYSGTENKSNRPVMGLAAINNKNCLSSDAILRWIMPKEWTLAEGATVPFAYCIAYYAICECAALQPGELILIHNGCSSIGQAMIRVASHLGGEVYTTVGSEKQRITLLQIMKTIRKEAILDYTTTNFELQIREATRGDGVQVLVNCLPEDSLRAGLRCVSSLGRVILLLDENRLDEQHQESIGLSTFFRCFGMYGIRATKIFNLPEEIKKNLYNHVLNGIKENCVKPINKVIFQKNGRYQLNDIVKYLTGPKVIGTAVIPIEDLVSINNSANYSNEINKIDSTYIIYGGEDVDNIITLTYWLATSYGAKKIAILSSHSRNLNNKKHLERNLTTLSAENNDVNIKLLEVSVNKPDLVLQQIVEKKITNIASVLILSNGNNQNDEMLIRKLQTKFPTTHIALLSSIVNSNLINLERYHTRSLKNVSFLRWDKKLRLLSILKSLTACLEEVVDIFVRDNKIAKTQFTIFTSQDFCNLLSSSVSSLLKYSPVQSNFIVEPMVSRNTRHTNDLAPMFIVPGLLGSKCSYLQTLVRYFLNPAYIIDAVYGTLTLEQLAVRLGEHVCKIYPQGPYNLIGVSTGGPLAIELAKHLETDLGATVQLSLLDGIPNTIQYLLSPAGDRTNIEVTLLKKLLNIHDSKLLERLSTLPNWNARVDAVLPQSSNKLKEMREILQALKQRVDAAIAYKPSKRIFNGKTHVIFPEETILDVSVAMEDIKEITFKMIKGNHFTMLQKTFLVDYINENTLCPVYYCH